MLKGMLVQPCFKQTEIGEIPEDWNVVKIGDVGTLSSGSTPSRDNPSYFCRVGGHAWVKTMNLTDSDVSETDERITDLALKQTSCRLNPPKTVMIAMYGGFNQIGRTGVLRIEAATNQAICCINVDQNKLDPDYCNTWLVANRWRWKNIAASSRKDPNITKEDVRAFPIVLPPLAEQKKIAEILSSVDEAIASTQAVIDQTRKVKQGILQQLLTRGIGHTKFKESAIGKIPKEWEVSQLGSTLDSIDAGWSPNCPDYPPEVGDWGVLKVSAVTRGAFLEEESKALTSNLEPRTSIQVHQGDILMARANGVAELVGQAVQVRREPSRKLMLSDKTLRLVPNPNQIDSEFLTHLLSSALIREQIGMLWGGSSGQKNIAQAQIRQLMIPLPSITEQRKIADILESFVLIAATFPAKPPKKPSA